MDHEISSDDVAQQFSKAFSVLFKWLDRKLTPPQAPMMSELPAPSIERLLTVDQAAKLLNISRAKLYQMIQCEEFPAVRMGSAVRVRPQDLQQFIDGNTV